MKKVVILGGGVAGMSAAHELVKRGFEVEIYELKNIPGGKARSIAVADSAEPGYKALPGEHGFRFFPRFYRHVTATMTEIPFKNNPNGVFDNLIQTSEIRIARFNDKSLWLPARFPGSFAEIKKYIDKDFGINLGLNDEEKDYFSMRIWQLMTSCYERRKHEYERIGWWEFIEADRFSEAYRTFFAKGLTRTLVAARAETVSTKTGGDILLQLAFDILKPGMSSDRILNGPTNDVWIGPWYEHLLKQGVKYHFNAKAVKFNCKGEEITSVIIHKDGTDIEVTGDYYIAAVPVEIMASLINDDLLKTDPSLNNIKLLAPNVAWMNGLQLYLTADVQINHGHTIYIDTPWSITSISQTQFWKDFDWSQYGDGKVKGILSIDISNWDAPGVLYNKPASECTTQEIVKEVWEQLKMSLNVNGEIILQDDFLHKWNLDPDIVVGVPTINMEPLLVNNTNTWPLRPYAYCDIVNLFFASDYVKTNTDLATMEGANEAARRAVNCIIDASGAKAQYCKIWNLHEPFILSLFRYKDHRRYKKGLPWDGNLPFGFEALSKFVHTIYKILLKLKI